MAAEETGPGDETTGVDDPGVAEVKGVELAIGPVDGPEGSGEIDDPGAAEGTETPELGLGGETTELTGGCPE
jgi:hypothetical protein